MSRFSNGAAWVLAAWTLFGCVPGELEAQGGAGGVTAMGGGGHGGGEGGTGGLGATGGTSSGGANGGTGGAGGGAGPEPRCAGLPDTCGPDADEDCCVSSVIQPGSFDRSNDPAYPAALSRFILDRFEVTVGRFRMFVEAGGGTQQSPPADGAGESINVPGSGWQQAWNEHLAPDTAALRSSLSCIMPTWTDSPADNETRPVGCVSWFEAFAFCIWDGGRLPTEAEWNYAAAGGNEQRVYPWSSPPSSTDIDCTNASYDCHNSVCSNGIAACQVTDFIDVGTKPAGDGRYGHADMAGNVWEWVFDGFSEPYTNPCVDCANLDASGDRVIRGGGAGHDASVLTTSFRYHDEPLTLQDDLGFRCARDE